MEPLEKLLLGLRQVRDDAVQEKRGLVEQPLGRLHILDHDALGGDPEPGLFLLREVLSGKDNDGQTLNRVAAFYTLQQLEAGHVGQSQVDDTAIESGSVEGAQRLSSACDVHDLNVVMG